MTELVIENMVPNGDSAWLITFTASPNRLSAIHSLCSDLLATPLTQQINAIPATESLVLVFSSQVSKLPNIEAELVQRVAQVQVATKVPDRHEIPVCYHPDVASDLRSVCVNLAIDVKQLIAWHVAPVYRVNMLGFLPGFAYLANNHPALDIPRKDTPALSVPAGSVAIAGRQTGMYSLASPGGWQVIGRTPQALLDWQQPSPSLLKPLDQVKFKAISLEEFKQHTADQ